MDNFELVKSILNKKYDVTKDVNHETNFSDLGLDSIDVIDLIMSVETELNITLEDKAMGHVKVIQDLLNLIDM